MGEHALLSASSAHRWTSCSVSARLEEFFDNKETEFSKEGTVAHELAERILNDKIDNIEDYPSSMVEYVQVYVNYVNNLFNELNKNGQAFKEHEVKVNFAKYVPEGFGTADTIIIADGVLHVIDLKYGQGVMVSATNNPQLRCYGIGALEEYDCIYSIEKIVMHIVQPRLDNISTEDLTADELRKWANDLKESAVKAFNGEGDACAGEHCQFCKARSVCRERTNNLKALQKLGQDYLLLSDEELVELWPKLDDVSKLVKNIQSYVLNEMLKGHKFKGLKLVEGRSLSRYADDAEVTKALTEAGYDEALFTTRSIVGITEMKSLLGAKKYRELLEQNGLIVKPQGSPKVALESDKREEYSPEVSLDEFEALND